MEYHGSMDKKGHKSRASLGKPPRNGLDSEQRDHTHYASVNWDYDWMGLWLDGTMLQPFNAAFWRGKTHQNNTHQPKKHLLHMYSSKIGYPMVVQNSAIFRHHLCFSWEISKNLIIFYRSGGPMEPFGIRLVAFLMLQHHWVLVSNLASLGETTTGCSTDMRWPWKRIKTCLDINFEKALLANQIYNVYTVYIYMY